MIIADAFKPPEYIEFALIGIGVLILIVGAARLVRAPHRAAIFANPTPPRFTALDIFIVFLVWACAGEFAVRLAAPPVAASQPTTTAASPKPTPVQYAVASVCSPTAGLLAMLFLAPKRVTGGVRAWGLNADRLLQCAMVALLGYLAIWPVCAASLWLTRMAIKFFDPAHVFDAHSTIGFLRATEHGRYWIPACLILGAVVLAPLYEELFFRGMIQTTINRYSRSPWAGVCISAAVFGAFHISNIETIPPLIIFGLALGYAYARTRSLTIPFLMHFFFNAKTILWLLVGAEA